MLEVALFHHGLLSLYLPLLLLAEDLCIRQSPFDAYRGR